LAKPRPVIVTSQFKLGLDVDPFAFKETLNGLSLSSAIRTATRLALRGYGDRTGLESGNDPFSLVMVESRLIDMELNFREFGQAVGFLDPRQNNAPQRTFKEGNFFTFSGNGDARLDASEIFELLHFMLSASNSLTQKFEKLIEENQGHLKDLDSLLRPKSSETVFRNVMEENFSEIFDNMPQLVKSHAKMSAEEWSEIYGIVMSISKSPDSKNGVTEYTEIRSVVSILQYVESLMQQFDLDRSGGLSSSELQAAEPRFHEIIKAMSPIKSDRFVQEAFIYLVFRGKIPSGNLESAVDVAKFIEGRWRGESARWNLGEASRLQLFRVLSVLKVNAL
jgi:rubrerythrin